MGDPIDWSKFGSDTTTDAKPPKLKGGAARASKTSSRLLIAR